MYIHINNKAVFIEQQTIKEALKKEEDTIIWKELSHCNSFIAADTGSANKSFKTKTIEGIFDENAIGGIICCHQCVESLTDVWGGEK